MKSVGCVGILLATAVIVAASGWRAWAGPDETQQASAQEESAELWTPEEHFARAASYREKAVSYRAEAEMHREMLAEYEKKPARPRHKTTSARKSPSIEKMRTHCKGFIEAAEELAAEADQLAELFQTLGEEMRRE